jgi:dTDP-4-dehydrorhamnose 3,5-epimerase
LFCAEEFASIGWRNPVAQINHTMTHRRGTVRGMHFQYPPYAERKLISCLQGEIWDVAVDLRRDSSTFLHWHGETLSAGNQRSLLIPEGFAHGFQTLTEDCELIYLHSATYQPEVEGALNPADPELAIAWPHPISEMSERDRQHPPLGPDFQGVAA